MRMLKSYFKNNKLIYSIYTILTNRDYQLQKIRMKDSTIKSKEHIKEEMKMYSEYWGRPAHEYIRYGLFEKNLSKEEILDYIPSQFFYCNYLPISYKNVDVTPLDNKLMQYKMMKEASIPTPDILCIVRNKTIQTIDGKLLSFEYLKDSVKNGERLFIKPIDGRGGTGIIVLSKKDGVLIKKNCIVENIEMIGFDTLSVYEVQKGIVQHPDLSKINKDCLNTLRTIVQYRDGKTNIVGCVLRMGRKGAEVDNSAQGGISIGINLEDGSFKSPAIAEHGGETFFEHPDSGFLFNGNKLPNWEKIKEQMITELSKMSVYNDLGWDIAITADGIVAIEFNFGYGIVHAQMCCGGLRRKLCAYPKGK